MLKHSDDSLGGLGSVVNVNDEDCRQCFLETSREALRYNMRVRPVDFVTFLLMVVKQQRHQSGTGYQTLFADLRYR